MPRSPRAQLRAAFFALALLLVAVLTTGCATIIHGTEQRVGITSNPSGATVTIDGANKGATPLVLSLSRKHDHIIWLNRTGYQKASATITRNVSAWILGNIIFGLIGLAVDAFSGGIFYLAPEHISLTLKPVQATTGGKSPPPVPPRKQAK